MTEQSSNERRSRLITALILIAVGGILLIGQLTEQWEFVLLVLGVGFLGAYFLTRNYGFLVPGGILSGIGVGVLLETLISDVPGDFEAALFLVPFGCGFILIWILDRVYTQESNWWPLIPGGIMVVIGLAVGIGGVALDLLALVGTWWPLILVLIGGWILFNLWREGQLGGGATQSREEDWNDSGDSLR